MPVLPAQVTALTLDEVPKEMRPWVEAALVVPLNRLIDNIRTLLTHGVSLGVHVNAQVMERRFTAPNSEVDWSSHRFDTPLTLSGSVRGLQVLGCWTLDTAGHDVASLAGLSSPSWREVAVDGKKVLRLLLQPGLTEGVTYRLLLLAWGA